MDEDFNMWLIEVNTNPCIEESSEMLKYYLRRMIEDMIKIEIDSKFPRPKRHKKGETVPKDDTNIANNSRNDKKKRKSICLVGSKNEGKRRLSYHRVSSSNQKKRQPSLVKRGISKSSMSKRMTCRSSNNDSFGRNKVNKSNNINSFMEFANETGSKHLSLNSKEFEFSPVAKKEDDDNNSVKTL